MSSPKPRRDRLLILIGILGLLLVALATLQYRWIEQLSEADAQRRRAALDVAAERFAEDLDRELTRAFLYFLPAVHHAGGSLEERLAARWRLWAESAPDPELIAAVYAISPGAGGRLERLRPDGSFEAVPWPPILETLRQRRWRRDEPAGGPPEGRGLPPATLPDAPAVVLWGGPPGGGERGTELAVLLLDRDFLTGDLLPRLFERHFGTGDEEYEVTVRSAAGGAPIFHGGGELGSPASADSRWELFRVRPFPELYALDPGLERPAGGAAEWWRRPRSRAAGHAAPHHHAARPGSPHRSDGGWLLEVGYRAGSLDAAVARSRHRNLAVSLGVLGLLAVAVLLTVLTARRAQRLARQQLELVAGVTHELYTPLAALRSAGQNLADGVVSEPQQVRRYGALVEDEGRRLSTMVQRMLDLAGLGSGQRALAREPVAVAELVASALDECRPLFEARRIEVETDLPADLPPLLGDADALRRALVNLLENAAQHGGAGGWVGLRARTLRGGRRLALVVEDRGPGLDGEDLAHLFEPFYRGRRVSSQVHGSGLGLSLVQRIAEAHGGRASAGPGSGTGPGGRGAAFTLELPVAGAVP